MLLIALLGTCQAWPIELFQTPLYNDPSLVSYWRFEGNSIDSKSANNGLDTAITYSPANGKFGQGASFNGSNSRIITASATLTNSITWSLWIRPNFLPGAAVALVPLAQTDSAGGGKRGHRRVSPVLPITRSK